MCTKSNRLPVGFAAQTEYLFPSMAVVIPATFENNFALEDGKPGDDLRQAFKFSNDSVSNLYRLDGASGKLISSFTETGVAYNETEKTSLTSEATLDLSQPGGPSVTLELEEKTIEKWGTNFAGVIKVVHSTGEQGVIYIPGTRTYDPAGLTGMQCIDIYNTQLSVRYVLQEIHMLANALAHPVLGHKLGLH